MKEKFIKSTLILLVGGLLTKILGMIIKIVMSRLIGTEGLGIYMMILPTFSLFIGLAQFGIPNALSKLIAENNRSTKNLFSSVLPLSVLINVTLMVIIIIIAPIIANNLLHDNRTYLSLLAIALVIPFTSISSICRSYFFGKEKMLPHILSNLTEDVIRLLLMFIGIPIFLVKGLNYAVCFIVLSNIISEFTSILILLFFLPRNITITKNDLKPNKEYLLNTFSLSLPITTSRLIGSFGYFLEPIILTNALLLAGYNTTYITTQYGVISGYVIPLLLLPSFFTLAISQALLPIVSREYSQGHIKYVKNKIRQAIFFSLLIGIPATLVFLILPEVPLKFIYNTTEGTIYLKVLAIFGLFQYIQSPLTFSLEAMGKAKDNMKATILGVVTRTSLLFILSLFKIGIYSLIIATSINILVVTSHNLKNVKKYLKT